MKYLVALAGLLSALANAGVFSTEKVQAYPTDWPTLSRMSETCSEVQGAYADPNRWRWEREEFPGSPLGSKYGGTREAAWMTFGFAAEDVRSEDQKVKERTFVVSLGSDQSITISYLVDERVVATRGFAKDKLSCTSDGLTITTLERSGSVLDKFPNKGRMLVRSTLYKQQGYLYVKTTHQTTARVVQVIPQSFLNVVWFRFQERSVR
jgi:hypothetical protein